MSCVWVIEEYAVYCGLGIIIITYAISVGVDILASMCCRVFNLSREIEMFDLS
jgi:hypothetical protein